MTKWKGKAASLSPALPIVGSWSCVALAAATLAVSPSSAQAAAECGAASAGATLVCDADGIPATDTVNQANGVTYTNADGLTLKLNDSDLTISAGSAARGVTLTSTATSAAALTLDVSALKLISTTNKDAVFVQSNSTNGNDLNVFLRAGDIKTTRTSTNVGYGVYVNAGLNNAGDIAVTLDGARIETSGSASGGFGVYAYHQGAGASTVTMSGSDSAILTSGAGARGIYMYSSNGASGDATANLSGGVIRTDGGSAYGIQVLNYGGAGRSIINMSGGSVTTLGNAAALLASGNAGQTGATVVNLTGGSVDTRGADADGLIARNQGSGNAVVGISEDAGSVQIVTSGDAGDGATAWASSSAAASVTMSGGVVRTEGANAKGLRAYNQGSGSASVALTGGEVRTLGGVSDAIFVQTSAGATLGTTATARLSGGVVDTRGAGASGVQIDAAGASDGSAELSGGASITTLLGQGLAVRNRGTGTAEVVVRDGAVTTSGTSAYAAYAWVSNATSGAASTVQMDAGDITTNGSDGRALFAFNQGRGDASVRLDGGSIETTGGSTAYAAAAIVDNILSGANASVTMNAGRIGTSGQFAHGLLAENRGGGDADATLNDGQITTAGANARGVMAYITAVGTGDAHAAMDGGTVTTSNFQGQGVLAQALSTQSSVYASMSGGAVTTSGAQGYGVRAVLNSLLSAAAEEAAVTVTGGRVETTGDGAHAYSSVNNGRGVARATLDNATATTSGAGSHGLLVQSGSGSSAAATVTGATLTASGVDSDGVQVAVGNAAATYAVSLDRRAVVMGGSGSGAGVRMSSVAGSTGALDIGAGARLGALSDYAIVDGDGVATIVNDGTVTGYVTTGAGDDRFTNTSANSWDVRDFATSADPTVRDTENVARSDFGAGFDTFTNTASGTVRLLTVEDRTGFTADASDNAAPTRWLTSGVAEYVPEMADPTYVSARRSIVEAGVEQAHLVNLEVFDNAGVLTMADAETGGAGPVAGDVFVITAKAAADGTAGAGTYISNGGQLHIDTVLDGGAVDDTDLLVVDGVRTGSGATSIRVTSARPGTGAGTDANGNGVWDEGEGILIVQVLDAARSASDAFSLAAPVVDNGIAYKLYFGSVGGDWFLAICWGRTIVASARAAASRSAVQHASMKRWDVRRTTP